MTARDEQFFTGFFAKRAEEFSGAPPDQPLMAQSGKRRMRQVQETRRILKMMIYVKKTIPARGAEPS